MTKCTHRLVNIVVTLKQTLQGCLLMAALMLATGSGAAQSVSTIDFSEANVKAELLSEMQTVQAGTTVWVFLKQTIREGWHTYWRNPGDSGAPTKLLWDLPPGFEAGGDPVALS